MLRELHIANLAVIEDLAIEFGEGLNCFTGETGAGKSLILGAFEILLGLRSVTAAEVLRPDATEARVSGLFEIHDEQVALQVAQLADQPVAVGDQLLITRKIFASGRSSLSINGQPATAAMVRAIGQQLVDIHGQHDHQYLLRPANQLLILDTFGRCLPLRERYSELFSQLRQLRQRLEELTASEMLRRQQYELFEFHAQEIDAIAPYEGEFEELKARHTLLSNLSKIRSQAAAAHAAMYESEGSIVERLQVVTHLLGELAELDGELSNIAEQVKSATLTLQESAFLLGRYSDRLELDPGELTEVESRLNALNRLIAKHARHVVAGEDPVAQILAYREQIEQQIRQLRQDDQDFTQIEQQIESLTKELAAVGVQLSQSRRAAAGKLKPLIEVELKQVGMSEAGFDVEFTSHAGDDDDADESASVGRASGPDHIEMLVRTNPGQPARPLRKIASGGELSRIMLSLKSILAHHDRVSILVFDEIDANIGGRMGTIIGQKLRKLCDQKKNAGNHQVLCITHLPQIAAFADRHLRIAKEVTGKGKARKTTTTVTPLEGDARVSELAEMLAGKDVTVTTRKQVQEMLAAAR